MTHRIPGIVLAGGRSRRMGRDKALVRLAGRPLLAWTVLRLAPQVSALAISRHDGRLDGVALPFPVLADVPGEHAGPLAGLMAGLDWAAEQDAAATHAVTVAVDMPFLPMTFVARLQAEREASGASGSVAASGGRRHPVAALWPIAARHELRAALLGEGFRRVGLFLDRFAPAVADWPTVPFDPFLNLNTAEDLAAAEAIGAEHFVPTLPAP